MISAKVGKMPPQAFWDATHPEQPFYVQSRALPGRTLKVWRTDSIPCALPNSDMHFLQTAPFPLNKVTHLRHEHAYGATRYDVIVQTLEPIPELPQAVAEEHA